MFSHSTYSIYLLRTCALFHSSEAGKAVSSWLSACEMRGTSARAAAGGQPCEPSMPAPGSPDLPVLSSAVRCSCSLVLRGASCDLEVGSAVCLPAKGSTLASGLSLQEALAAIQCLEVHSVDLTAHCVYVELHADIAPASEEIEPSIGLRCTRVLEVQIN